MLAVRLDRQPGYPLGAPLPAEVGAVNGRYLSLLLPLYIEERRTTGHPVDASQYHLAMFDSWWRERAGAFDRLLTPESLQDFARWLGEQTEPHTGRPLAPPTAGVMLRSARAFLRWLYRSGHVAVDLSVWLMPSPSMR